MPRSLRPWLAITCALGCSASAPATSDFPTSPKRVSNALCLAPAHAPPGGKAMLERAFTRALPNGGRVRKPIQLVPSPTQPNLYYLVLQTGQILQLSDQDDASPARTVLDIADRIDFSRSENGLVSLAFHPDFLQHRYAYVVRSAPSNVKGHYLSLVTRFGVGKDGTFDPKSERVLIQLDQQSLSHSGNHIAFGQDGYLYHSHGNDQGVQDSQDPGSRYGAIWRIDVDHVDEQRGLPYAIPSDNPFAKGGVGAPEVYAYGFRNPWRFTVDPVDGRIFVGDVGQDAREEIDELQAGGNYGWPLREGKTCYEADTCAQDFVEPLVDYTHEEGTAVVAGYRYRGSQLPWLRDRLLYADVGVGTVFGIPLDQSDPAARVEVEGSFHIVSFTQRRDGELYVVRYDFEGGEGGVYALLPRDDAPSDFPALLSQTGCVDPSDPRKPSPSVVPFEPSARLWSDGADKTRFFALADTSRLSRLPAGDLEFPVGSVLMKNFSIGGRYHETRLLMHHEDGWGGYSYAWRDDQSDAELLQTGQSLTLPDGTRWMYPGRAQCFRCHSDAVGVAIGPEVGLLDHDNDVHGEVQGQLEWLYEHDYFRPELDRLEALREEAPPMPDPLGDAPLADRARAYLHVNCSICHRPGGGGRGGLDLRFSRSLADMHVCGQTPERRISNYASHGAQQLLKPGVPEDSVLWIRMQATDRFRMPPLATAKVDEDAVALIAAWIESIARCP